jgi:hypothetical protein
MATAAYGSDLFAERITAANAARRQVGGPDATAGIGDWALGNGTLCAAVSDTAHESDLSDRGAVLIDLGHCGAADDQWTTLQPILNLSQSSLVPVSEIRAEQEPHEARIVTRGVLGGVEIETTYALGTRTPEALGITTRMTRTSPGPRFFAHGTVVLHPNGSLRPFTAQRRAPGLSRGFDHPGGDPAAITSMLAAIVPADLLVWVGSSAMGPGIAYGLELGDAERIDADGSRRRAPAFSITGPSYTLAGTLVRPFWFGDDDDPGLLELAQAPLMNLELGDALVLRRRLWVGRRADVASITDHLQGDAPILRGAVGEPDAVVHVEAPEGSPLTTAAVDDAGDFAVRLPPGRYRLRALAPGWREVVTEVEHPGQGQALALELPAAARVHLPRGHAMRLTFRGLGETPNPHFGDDGFGLRIDGHPIPGSLTANDVVLSGTPYDVRTVIVPPGRYRVYAARGPEYDVTTSDLTVEAAQEATLDIVPPPRVAETRGWVSADLHVHTGAGFDSALPPVDQVAAFHAAAAEVLVATEHDRIVDPGPAIASLGLSDQILGVTGVEVTSEFKGGEAPYTNGHANAFPVIARPEQNRGGAPRAEGVRLRDVWAELRQRGDPILQLNHPRQSADPDDGQSFLSHLAVVGRPFDPTRPLDADPNRALLEAGPHGLRDIDFDAMELLNGHHHEAYTRARTDWFAFLQQGERITATANSDSHHLRNPVALPRNYVRVQGAEGPLSELEPSAFFEAIRGGASFGTTGPLLEVALGKAEPGQTHSGSEAELRVRVDAAPWVPVEEVRVFVNGVLAEKRAIDGPGTLHFPLQFPSDSFVTVEAEGSPGEIYSVVAPRFLPLAFTNAIYVDADRNGRFDPPGLP